MKQQKKFSIKELKEMHKNEYLSKIEKDIFFMYYAKNYRIIDIAEETNYSKKTVQNKLKNIRIKLEI